MHLRAIQETFNNAHFTYATAHVGWTYKYWYLLNRKAALDHIFTRGANVIEAGEIPGRKAGDHLPVWSEIEI